MSLADEEFMLFTSYKRDGTAVGLPVWLVALPSGELGFTTGAESFKVKRITRNPQVTVQACDRRGTTTHGPVHAGTARLANAAEREQVRRLVRAKYRVLSRLIELVTNTASRLRGKPAEYANAAVIVTLADPAAA